MRWGTALQRTIAIGLAVLGLSLCAASWGADAQPVPLRASSRVAQPVIEPASGG